ncbi:MAG: radical SAM protein, partial [Deltaproteobacteria bacterium]|nr:radical SAM protein [Deltaproteobacteria bacterium]
MSFKLIPQKYYRLPWSLTDNGISWIEVTTSCNLACEGCYRPKAGGHKSLEQIAEDLAVFKQERKSDCMSVAGGDPLVHPKIVEITKMIKDGDWKPIINTNGLALTPKLLKDLKTAGAFGFTFHIDTSQVRRDS